MIEEHDNCIECGNEISSEYQNKHPGTDVCGNCTIIKSNDYPELDDQECNGL